MPIETTALRDEDLEGYEILRNPETDEPEWVVLPLAVWRRVPDRAQIVLKVAGLRINDELGAAFLRWPGFVDAYEDVEDAVDAELADNAAEDARAERETRLRAGAREPGIPLDVVQAELAGMSPIAAWRHHRKLTQAALAAEIGIDRGYLALLERGNRSGSVETLAKIARALGCIVDDLILSEENER